jgi:hypothetical protein
MCSMGGEPSIYKRMDGGTWAQAGRELNTLDRQARVCRVPTAAASSGLAAHNGKRACLPLHERAQTLQYAVLFLATQLDILASQGSTSLPNTCNRPSPGNTSGDS